MPNVTSALAAASLIGGGLTAFGTFRESQEAKDTAEYNAAIAKREAGIM